MGKKNSKLKQETVDQLISETYCKYLQRFFLFVLIILPFFHAVTEKEIKQWWGYMYKVNNLKFAKIYFFEQNCEI